MKPKNNDERKKMQWRFAGFYAFSLVLMILILSSFWGPLPSMPIKGTKIPLLGNTSQKHQILLADEMLHEHLNQLQQLDKKYITLLSDSATGPGLRTIIETITQSEQAYSRLIDSIDNSGKNYSAENKTNFENMIASFRVLLENRSFSNNRRNTLFVNNNSQTSNSELLRLKKDIQSRDAKISRLENDLKTQDKKDFSYPVSPDDKLRQENDFLKIALRSQIVQTNTLQKSNDQLKSRINELQKTAPR